LSLLPLSSYTTPQINGAFKQNGTTADMIFKIPRLIEHISSIMTLEVRPQFQKKIFSRVIFTYSQEGDLVLTGTPSGVGQVSPGDKVECTLADSTGTQLATLDFVAVTREGGYQFTDGA
jgi:acylpyruvate hydrolase